MKLVEITWRPRDRQLRQFGLISLVALPLLGWLWGAGTLGCLALAGGGVVLAGIGLLAPQGLRPVFVGLSLITWPIGMVVSEVALLCLFYAVFVPIGLVLQFLGREPLERKFDPQASSYWQPKKRPPNAASYFRRW